MCGVKGCEYKAKAAGDLRRHKASVHDIDATYYSCGVDECEYKAKTAGNLKRHKAMVMQLTFYAMLMDANIRRSNLILSKP